MFFAMLAGQVAGRMADPFGWVLNVALYLALKRWLPWWGALLLSAALSATILQIMVAVMISAEGRSVNPFGWFFWILVGLIEAGLTAFFSSRAFRAMFKPDAPK